LALIEAGCGLTDQNVTRGLRWMDQHGTDEIRGIGLRCEIWQAGEEQMPGKFTRRFRIDLNTLLSQCTAGGYPAFVPEEPTDTRRAGRDPSRRGRPPTRTAVRPDLYATSYAQTAVAAAATKLRVPRGYWPPAGKYWVQKQRSNGGWDAGSGRPGVADSAAAVAALATCLRSLHGDEAMGKMAGPGFAPLKKSLAHLESELPPFLKSMRDQARRRRTRSRSSSGSAAYYELLYELTRAAAAVGPQAFNRLGGYDPGREFLLNSQSDAGQWGPDAYTTALSVLFLTRGPRLCPHGPQKDAGPQGKARAEVLQQIAIRRKILAAQPNNLAARKALVRLYLVELRDPKGAAAEAGRLDPRIHH
jgi:hypothetical protein